MDSFQHIHEILTLILYGSPDMILSSLMRNCSLLEEKGFPLVLSSVESILVYFLSERPKRLPFERREFYFTFSREASKERILSVEIKGCFYFKMVAQNQRTLKLIWEMVESLTVCTPSILGLILKNNYFDNN